MRVIFRGQAQYLVMLAGDCCCSWCCWRVFPVAPRIVLDVSCVSIITPPHYE